MNEEEKQNLIEDCEEEIEQLKGRINRTNYTGGCTKYLESCLKRQKIALNSLRAEPELWEIMNPGEGTYYNPHGPRDYEQVDTLWYKTPPIVCTGDWIKCSERMPDEGIQVVVCNGNDVQICFRDWDGIRYFWEEKNYSIVIRGITHWQPLPTPEGGVN